VLVEVAVARRVMEVKLVDTLVEILVSVLVVLVVVEVTEVTVGLHDVDVLVTLTFDVDVNVGIVVLDHAVETDVTEVVVETEVKETTVEDTNGYTVNCAVTVSSGCANGIIVNV
jgi:hypothetical protein